jgi:hypothetical protein
MRIWCRKSSRSCLWHSTTSAACLDDDPVIAGENASDLALVPLGQPLHAHSGIIQLGAEVRSSGVGFKYEAAPPGPFFGRSIGVRCVAGRGKKGVPKGRNRRFRSLWDTGRARETQYRSKHAGRVAFAGSLPSLLGSGYRVRT